MDLVSWWQEVGNSFFGQPWIRWAAFLVLILSVAFLWGVVMKRIFG